MERNQFYEALTKELEQECKKEEIKETPVCREVKIKMFDDNEYLKNHIHFVIVKR